MAAVAQAMGYTNVGSAGNKWAQLKKKFNIDMGTFQGTEGKVGKTPWKTRNHVHMLPVQASWCQRPGFS